MNVLITDDEMIAIQGLLAGVRWELCGIKEVFTSYSVEEARKICGQKEVDILLCDIEMPGENGIELVRWIRDKYPSVECLFLTCHSEFGYAREAIQLGCNDYIVKPAPYSEIEMAICRLVEKIRSRDENAQLATYGRQWIAAKKEKAEADYGKKLTMDEIILNVENYVLGHLSEDISVEQLAGQVYLHPDYLNRLFKKVKKTSINKYIIGERMKVAARLLRESDMSAGSIALDVGYANYPNFVNMFKKVYGISPSQYREKETETGKIV